MYWLQNILLKLVQQHVQGATYERLTRTDTIEADIRTTDMDEEDKVVTIVPAILEVLTVS